MPSGKRPSNSCSLARVFLILMLSSGLVEGSTASDERRGENVGIGVFVYNSARAPAEVLERTKQVVARIYRAIGVDITWIDRKGRRLPDGTLTSMIAVRLVAYTPAISMDSPARVMGRAVVGGRIVEAFYHPLVRISRIHNADIASVLGHVVAHEIGHVLLTGDAHSPVGIMRPELDVRLAKRDGLYFTPDQGERIRRHLIGGGPQMLALAGR